MSENTQRTSDQSDTPMTDAAAFQLANDLRTPFLAQHVVVPVDFARAQEREIAQLRSHNTTLERSNARLRAKLGMKWRGR